MPERTHEKRRAIVERKRVGDRMRITIHVPPDLGRKFKVYCASVGRSHSDAGEQALLEFLREHEKGS